MPGCQGWILFVWDTSDGRRDGNVEMGGCDGNEKIFFFSEEVLGSVYFGRRGGRGGEEG